MSDISIRIAVHPRGPSIPVSSCKLVPSQVVRCIDGFVNWTIFNMGRTLVSAKVSFHEVIAKYPG